MSALISPEALGPVRAAEAGETPAWEAAAALAVLERELVVRRRTTLGACAVALGLVAGVALAAAAAAGTEDPAVLVVAGVVGLALLGSGAALGLRVLVAGRRVTTAYRTWSAVSEDPLDPSALVARQTSPRHLPRVAVGALCLVGVLFSGALAWGAVAPGDPVGVGEGRLTMLPLGLVWLATLGTASVALLGSELHSVEAHAGRVVRTRRRG